MKTYGSYSEFEKFYPLLAVRLHTLHCETNKPHGVSLYIAYSGTDTDGRGTIYVSRQYGHSKFSFSVVNGTIKAFGRSQNMRRPTHMRLANGARHNYGESTPCVIYGVTYLTK